MVAGVLSGALIGTRFHRDAFMGGYESFSRRLVRLGHISFFGLGILNVLYGLSAPAAARQTQDVGGVGLVVGVATMPTVCFLTAWHKSFRHLFALPVVAVLLGVGGACGRTWGRRS